MLLLLFQLQKCASGDTQWRMNYRSSTLHRSLSAYYSVISPSTYQQVNKSLFWIFHHSLKLLDIYSTSAVSKQLVHPVMAQYCQSLAHMVHFSSSSQLKTVLLIQLKKKHGTQRGQNVLQYNFHISNARNSCFITSLNQKTVFLVFHTLPSSQSSRSLQQILSHFSRIQ